MLVAKNKLAALTLGLAITVCIGGDIHHAPSASAETLQGGVGQDVQAVEPGLSTGTSFDQRAIPQEQIRGWYKIPPWFAGMTRRERIYSTANPQVSYKSERVRERGRQRDANGEIWECRREPISYQIDQGNVVDWTILRKEEPQWIGDNRVVMKYVGTMVKVAKANGKVVDVDQTVQTHDFSPGANGDINALIASTVHYDQAGKLRKRSQNDSRYTENRLYDFRVTDRDERFDYKRDFAAYLHSINRDDLIPR